MPILLVVMLPDDDPTVRGRVIKTFPPEAVWSDMEIPGPLAATANVRYLHTRYGKPAVLTVRFSIGS